MQVKAIESKNITVELDDFTVKEIVISQFCTVFDIDRSTYIKDGSLMYDVESHGGCHSWFDEKIIRVATEEDIAVVMVLKKLKREL